MAVVAGTVDAAVDQDGCQMERGVMAAEARLNVPVFDGAVDQDGCQMERGVMAAGFGRSVDMITSCVLPPSSPIGVPTPRSLARA